MGVFFSKIFHCSKSASISDDDSSDSSRIDMELQIVNNRKVADGIKKPAPPPVRRSILRTPRLPPLKSLLPNKIFCWEFRDENNMTRIERTVKATLLIQKWYRRFMARLEIRRRYTWNIFQSIEYQGEHDQVKLYNFFNALLTHIPRTTEAASSRPTSSSSSNDTLDFKFEDESECDEDGIERQDQSFHPNFPLAEEDLRRLMDIYKRNRHYRLHAKYVAQIFKHAIIALKKLSNMNAASTSISKQVTVCGDLHGKLDDLFVVFHKNGLPSAENPYIFNGDFVDRGKRGLEVLVILLSCFLVYPGGVFLNRGNHEDHIMNQRYGFIREVTSKYRKNAENLLKLVEGVYRWLPLGTIVNNKVLVVHGGISDTTDLDLIKSLDRGKYVSLLRPPVIENNSQGEEIDKYEWKQVFDILWSDPQPGNGCIPNKLRGAGTYFGPDVTTKFLDKSKLLYIVRSHECKHDGYEIMHDGKVITIFSASNYYEVGSNKGAYMTMTGPDLDTHFVQYMASRGKKLTFHQKVGLVEASAIRELHGQIMDKQIKLIEDFEKTDPDRTGFISVADWCTAMDTHICSGLPWRMLKEKLVTSNSETHMVKYSTTFENLSSQRTNSVQGASTVVETLYRNKVSLEAIFRIIDKDNSGFITMDEFSDACNLVKKHMPNPITEEQLRDICKMMDMNKDGVIDLNEFLESFRLVDPESRRTVQAEVTLNTAEISAKYRGQENASNSGKKQTSSPTSLHEIKLIARSTSKDDQTHLDENSKKLFRHGENKSGKENKSPENITKSTDMNNSINSSSSPENSMAWSSPSTSTTKCKLSDVKPSKSLRNNFRNLPLPGDQNTLAKSPVMSNRKGN